MVKSKFKIVNQVMHLCIDEGNSSTKTGIFKGNDLIANAVFEKLGEKEIAGIFAQYPVSHSIYSYVTKRNESIISILKEKVNTFIELTHDTPIPIINKYKTPHTLGKDRLAAVTGASFLKPGTNILVIDAGSAITYDFIDSKGIYRGGNISPGMDMRLKALHTFTQKLPLIKQKNESPLLGTDTPSAILSGVIYGITFEIDGYINEFRKEYPSLSTFLTGGSTFYFVNKLKSVIFANGNLVLIGLNRILQYNVQD